MKKSETGERDIIDCYDKIQSFAQSEIERVYKLFKILIWAVTIVFTVGVAIAAIVIGRSVSDVKDKYEQSVGFEFKKIQERLDQQIDSTRKIINARIKNEFEKENITLLVEKQARERVDLVADSLISKFVAARIQPVENRMSSMENATNKKIEKLIFEYYILQIDNDSRDAFTKVLSFAKDSTSEFKRLAMNKINETIKDLNKESIYVTMIVPKQIDFKKLTREEILEMYIKEIRPDQREQFINGVYNSKRSLKETMEILFDILKIEKELSVSYLVGKALVKNLKINVQPYDFEELLKYKY